MSEAREPEPFDHTKMTFGEHLEELRVALLRSTVGILVGFLIALLLAPTVVRWIEYPLKKALRRHYLAVAKNKLETDGGNRLAAEQWSAVDQTGMVPQRFYVDEEQLRGRLGIDDLARGELETSFFYRPQDIRTKSCRTIAGELVTQGTALRQSPEKAIWQSMSTSSRQSMQRLANGSDSTVRDRQALAEALNEVVDNPSLHQDAAFSSLAGLFPSNARCKLMEHLREQLLDDFDVESSRSLNRQLLDAVFADHLRSYRHPLGELILWRPVDTSVQALGVVEPFMIYIKAALVIGLILASPWVFHQIWSFVAAGLYPHEKRFVYRFLPFSIGLFLLGSALAFCFVFQPVLDFLFRFNRQLNISAEPRISDWISFVLILPLGFGISFQLPLVMLILERLGVITVETYVAHWRIAVLIVFVLSMFLTPADPMSMLLMGVPLTVLYFGGIALCKYAPAMHPAGPLSAELQTATR
jgi:sec-independent protein translocase protein TatC